MTRNVETYEIIAHHGLPLPERTDFADIATGSGPSVREAAGAALNQLIARGWVPSWQLEADVTLASPYMRGMVSIRVR